MYLEAEKSFLDAREWVKKRSLEIIRGLQYLIHARLRGSGSNHNVFTCPAARVKVRQRSQDEGNELELTHIEGYA